MAEKERVKKEIADLFRHLIIEYEKAWRGERCMTPEQMTDQILAIDGIEIRADNQTEPEVPYDYESECREFTSYAKAQRDIREEHFIRVLPKEK